MSHTPDATSHMSAPISLQRVRRLFSRPARVAESDFLRREVAHRMHEKLQLVRIEPARILDAGCGEGADLAVLQKQYPQAQVVGLDGAFGMTLLAADRQDAAMSSLTRLVNVFGKWRGQPGRELVCADFAQLPVASKSLDVLWSNLALHWHPQPHRVLKEWHRSLKVGGLVMFSSFGPDTFAQLRTALGEDAAQQLLPFVDMHDFGDMLVQAGFSTPVMDMERITVTYSSPEKLLADVRAWGGNPLDTRQRGLMGKGRYRALVVALEALRDTDGTIPLTFEVVYGHAFVAAPKTTSAGEAIIRLDFPKKSR